MPYPLSPEALAARATPPLKLKAQGSFWIGTRRVPGEGATRASGQMFVQYLIPEALKCPWPLVLVHGGGGQGTDYLVTPDGRPGWASAFARMGYAVYVVDRPGHGRAPFDPAVLGAMGQSPPYEFIESMFSYPERGPSYPRAELHTQWPEARADGLDVMDQVLSAMGPASADLATSHSIMQTAGVALLDAIGPSILVTHSAGGPFGWVVADARPGLVKGIVAVEPIGPPFLDRGPGGGLAWGLTGIPLTFDPPAERPEDLRPVERDPPEPDLVRCKVQSEPARRLPNLAGFPIVVVVGQASWMALDNHGAVDFLVQAGCQAELLRLEDHGVFGNGHAIMLEKNSDAAAAVIDRWIAGKVR
jgi:pimeloyl-ACP methyl ester carboxylesterase